MIHLRTAIALTCAFVSSPIFAAEITGVHVGGEDRAKVTFQGTLPSQVPTWKVNDGTLEVSFASTTLGPEIKEKLDLESPHALIRRLSLYSLDEQSVRAKIVLNGTTEGLKDRIRIGKDGGELILSVDYPKGQSATISLLKEEQKPISVGPERSVATAGKGYGLTIAIVLLTLASAAGATFLFTKFLRKKGGLKGSRKFLIEQLGYCPLGTKTGVSLLKIGTEFVLVGVTPNQVSMLSSLPKLQEQYEEEASFERGVFKESVAEEVRRLK